jgi:hypothetical protein
MTFVRGTLNTVCVSLIVAVSMERQLVTEFFSSAQAGGEDMVDFDQVSVFEEQSTPAACSLLFLQQLSQRPSEEGVLFEPGAPIQQVSIIGAGSPPHLRIPADSRIGVPMKRGFVLRAKAKAFSFIQSPILVDHPSGAFAWVSAFAPPKQLTVEEVIASSKIMSDDDGAVVVRPSPHHWIKDFDDLFLWGCSESPHDLPCFF